ncbi:unnamed protein product, partial [marine sediment metagenome]
VAFVLGGMMLYAAILDRGWCYQMRIARIIDVSKGREQARTFIGGVGTLLLLIAIYLVIAPLVAPAMIRPTDIDEGHSEQSTGAINLAETD